MINPRFHHIRRKMRVLLNKKIEPLPIDLCQSASGLRDSVGSTQPLFDQRCLADKSTFLCRFDIITNPDVDFPSSKTYILSALSPSR